jgi:hypothetical protein
MLYCVMQSGMFTWMRILLTFFVGLVSWVLANISDWVFSFLWRWKRNSERQCLQNGLPEVFGRLLYAYLWRPSGVTALHHCYLWWRWRNDSLWATQRRLWLYLFEVFIIICLPTPTVGSWWNQWLVIAVVTALPFIMKVMSWYFVGNLIKLLSALVLFTWLQSIVQDFSL